MKILNFIVSLIFASLLIVSTAAVISLTEMGIGTCIVVSASLYLVIELLNKFVFKNQLSGIATVTICGKINANIARSCAVPLQGGTTDRATLINFSDISSIVYATDGETIEDIILVSGASAFYIDGSNNSINPSAVLAAQEFEDMFDHSVQMKGFDLSPAAKSQFNAMVRGARIVVICENFYRGNAGNAAFEVYGLTTGLQITALVKNPNDAATQGAFDFTLGTKLNKEPKLPNTLYITSYAASKAVVTGLL